MTPRKLGAGPIRRGRESVLRRGPGCWRWDSEEDFGRRDGALLLIARRQNVPWRIAARLGHPSPLLRMLIQVLDGLYIFFLGMNDQAVCLMTNCVNDCPPLETRRGAPQRTLLPADSIPIRDSAKQVTVNVRNLEN